MHLHSGQWESSASPVMQEESEGTEVSNTLVEEARSEEDITVHLQRSSSQPVVPSKVLNPAGPMLNVSTKKAPIGVSQCVTRIQVSIMGVLLHLWVRALEDFNEFMMLAELLDASFVGDKLTWTNNKVWKRLDQVLISPSWGSFDFLVCVEHLSRVASNHCPLLITFPKFSKPIASFRFQNMWIKHHNFMLTAEEDFSTMEKAFDLDPSEDKRLKMVECQDLLFQTLDMEEVFWRQKAAIKWIGERDENTKFFHNLMKKRRMASRIFRIWEEGVCLDKPELIQALGAHFFEELLTGEEFDYHSISMHNIPMLVGSRDNLLLATLLTRGQSIDEGKSLFYPSKGISAAHRGQIAAITGFVEGKFLILYLGTPIFARNRKVLYLQPLLEKVRKKLLGWNVAHFSHGGRLLLIKSVLGPLAQSCVVDGLSDLAALDYGGWWVGCE
ncbi:hypothetical protein ZIOFF_068020 [Zingiber officinale]|uniref:Uncharacterized protein n=1 Tax=Zingiber officinale TaxID=94328 RepID=A0A8J5CGH6_ZINOF|nr:hypothetical protein ZIOFF_068020 [Zingiber officinale]